MLGGCAAVGGNRAAVGGNRRGRGRVRHGGRRDKRQVGGVRGQRKCRLDF